MAIRFIPPIQTLPEGYSSYNKYTAGVFHAYADSSMPDDTGDGLSWLTAKKTLAAAVSVLPDIAEDHVVLHLKGSFDLAGASVFINVNVSGSVKRLVIDGGSDVTIIDGPYTATSGTTTSLTDTARSWTPNALRGYFVEILDGPAVGYQYPIQSNTVDTLVVGKTWAAPGTPQYRIISPATEILSSSGTSYFYYTGKTQSSVRFQRLIIGPSMFVGCSSGLCTFSTMSFTAIICSEETSRINTYCPGSTYFWYPLTDPDNPAADLNTAKNRCGVSHRGGGAGQPISLNLFIAILYGPNVLNCDVKLMSCSAVIITSGSWIKSIEPLTVGKLELGYSTSYGTPLIIGDESSIGIAAKDSRVLVTKDAVIRNCTSHGIQLDNSTLECQSAILSGSGNGGAGVYLKNRSSVIFKEGYTPTLTGTAGDIAVTSETVADATWAQVAAGDPVEIMPDGSVKEVP